MTEEDFTQVQPTSEIIAGSAELRRTVLGLWQKIRIDWSYASEQLSNEFRAQKRLAASARRAIAETLYAMIRNLRTLDYALDSGGRPKDRERDELRLWATLVLEFSLPVARVTELAPAFDWQRVAEGKTTALAERDIAKRVGVAASLPDWLADHLVRERGDAALEIGLALGRRAPMTVRVNTLKTTREALKEELAAAGFETRVGEHCETALHFETRTNLFSTAAFRAGLFEAQDEGSQLIAALVAPPPKAKVIDFCAGAGGKSLALAAVMQNRGRIVAADIAHRKLAELRRRAKRGGVDNVASVLFTDEPLAALPKLLEAWRGKADRVLVDAPCTGIGALRRNPEIRWRLQAADVERFPELQLEILERALELVAPGGRLIYATCSLLRAENEDVVSRFLERHPSLAIVPPKEILGRAVALPISDSSEQFMSLSPDRHGTDGFFAAVLRKPNSNP